jgi:uncharacterized membrane protein (DUF106 family)
MSRTERKVADLVEDDPEMADALSVVRDRAADGGVEWADVNDELTSGQWGRLIEKGLIESNADDRFELADPEGVTAALDGDGESVVEFDDDEEIETTGWSRADKLAGLGVLALMTSYYFDPLMDVVGGTLDVFLGPLAELMPFYAVILVLATVTGVYSAVLQANLANTELMQRQQERMQAIQDEKEAAKERGDDEALDRIQDQEMEMMSDQMAAMKEQFRPMVWITLLTIPVFVWMWWQIQRGLIPDVQQTMVMPLVGEIQLNSSAGAVPFPAWIVWYFLCSMGFTQLIRKATDIQVTPTGGSSDTGSSAKAAD